MTEDLHNDIDDLFRSGLEGKEDKPSPEVWAAIAKNLPATPPPPPAPTGSAATGGLSSAAALKGLAGAVIIGMVGAAIYFFGFRGNQDSSNIPSQTKPSNIQEKSTNALTNNNIRQLNSDAKTEFVDQPFKTSDQQHSSNESVTVNPATTDPKEEKTGVDRKNISPTSLGKPGGVAEDRRENNTEAISVRNPISVTSPTADQTSDRKAETITEKNRNIPDKKSGLVQMNNKMPQNRGSSSDQKNAAAEVNRTMMAQSAKAPSQTGNPSDLRSGLSIPVALPDKNIAGLQFQTGMLSGSNKQHPTWRASLPHHASLSDKFKPAPTSSKAPEGPSKQNGSGLKRNVWTSRVYIIPTYSINMTRLEVEENESFGPRGGRAHIEFKETEKTRTTASPGIITGFAFTPRISLQTGISALRNDIEISPKQIKAVRDRDGRIRYRLDCSAGSYFIDPKAGSSPSVGDSLKIASSNISMRYVSIPLAMRVNIIGDRVKLFATAGGDFNMLTDKQTSTSLSASSTEKVGQVRSEGTRKSYLNGSLGAGVEVKAGKRLSIILTPQYRFPLSNINEEGPVRTTQKTFSITSGIRFGF